MLSQFARGLDKQDKYDFGPALNVLSDMHNKFNKHKRKQDFFQVRLTRERETFYKTCMNSSDNNKLKDVEKRMEEIKKTMRRK